MKIQFTAVVAILALIGFSGVVQASDLTIKSDQPVNLTQSIKADNITISGPSVTIPKDVTLTATGRPSRYKSYISYPVR